MADMADGEHATADGHSTTPANTDAQGDNGPVIDIITEGLDSVNVPKKDTPPEVMPHVDSPDDDIPAKGKELEGLDALPSNQETIVRLVGDPEKLVILLNRQIEHLENVGSSQVPLHRLKDITQMIESLVRKLGHLTSDEVFSEEKDLRFLGHLRDDILNIQEFDAKKETTPRALSNSTPGGVPPDPLLEALVAAPLSYRRRASANDIPARIPHR